MKSLEKSWRWRRLQEHCFGVGAEVVHSPRTLTVVDPSSTNDIYVIEIHHRMMDLSDENKNIPERDMNVGVLEAEEEAAVDAATKAEAYMSLEREVLKTEGLRMASVIKERDAEIERLQREKEVMDAEKELILSMGVVNNAMNDNGYAAGLAAGYDYALNKRIPLADVPDLLTDLKAAVNAVVAAFDVIHIPHYRPSFCFGRHTY
ncbi:hypothetical protein L1987_39864 [Smallanthus sonchifolius]|uniref:Uncharacterized protein n=1 Tax=Smallanthus sonchifolius TaxID=185202 RepID=A0ACB9GTB7_9ASTR|nr:hypothetical protein L1987_39864 [Smallanthus sonchifolius]